MHPEIPLVGRVNIDYGGRLAILWPMCYNFDTSVKSYSHMGFYLYGLFCRYRHEVAHSNGKLFVLGGGRATLVYTFEKVLIILVNLFF